MIRFYLLGSLVLFSACSYGPSPVLPKANMTPLERAAYISIAADGLTTAIGTQAYGLRETGHHLSWTDDPDTQLATGLLIDWLLYLGLRELKARCESCPMEFLYWATIATKGILGAGHNMALISRQD